MGRVWQEVADNEALLGSIALVEVIIAQASYVIPSILQYITRRPSIERPGGQAG